MNVLRVALKLKQMNDSFFSFFFFFFLMLEGIILGSIYWLNWESRGGSFSQTHT